MAFPAICPDCTLLVRPIFAEDLGNGASVPDATPGQLASAITDSIEAGANVINLSLSLNRTSVRQERELEAALDHAMMRRVLVVAATGNQGSIGGSAITRHPWVIPVVACDLHGRPVGTSNLGSKIGRAGLMAPGDNVTSLAAAGGPLTSGGTSVASAFVAGAIALLWSGHPRAAAERVKSAVIWSSGTRRTTIVPALLDAWAAHRLLHAKGRRDVEYIYAITYICEYADLLDPAVGGLRQGTVKAGGRGSVRKDHADGG